MFFRIQCVTMPSIHILSYVARSLIQQIPIKTTTAMIHKRDLARRRTGTTNSTWNHAARLCQQLDNSWFSQFPSVEGRNGTICVTHRYVRGASSARRGSPSTTPPAAIPKTKPERSYFIICHAVESFVLNQELYLHLTHVLACTWIVNRNWDR